RKGTPADTMYDQISPEVKKQRITALIAEQNKVTRQISKEMQGKTYEILVEDVNSKYPNTYCGRTENGRLVNFTCQHNPIGQFVDVVITKSQSATLWGELVK
ncbi:MAG: TRAM domain-containing protein, partial [Clostridia bacterium]|nr:TRAM domain-containing protein [Clostridia bacterium]